MTRQRVFEPFLSRTEQAGVLMTEYHFYLIYHGNNREEVTGAGYGNHAGNVMAVGVEPGKPIKIIAPTTHTANAPVTIAPVPIRYLAMHCREIPEVDARAIHPRLFEYLDHKGA